MSHMNESRHIWMSHVLYTMDVASRLYFSRRTRTHTHTHTHTHNWTLSYYDINESCHIWMRHFTYEWVTSHMNESRHICMSHVTYTVDILCWLYFSRRRTCPPELETHELWTWNYRHEAHELQTRSPRTLDMKPTNSRHERHQREEHVLLLAQGRWVSCLEFVGLMFSVRGSNVWCSWVSMSFFVDCISRGEEHVLLFARRRYVSYV